MLTGSKKVVLTLVCVHQLPQRIKSFESSLGLEYETALCIAGLHGSHWVFPRGRGLFPGMLTELTVDLESTLVVLGM